MSFDTADAFLNVGILIIDVFQDYILTFLKLVDFFVHRLDLNFH